MRMELSGVVGSLFRVSEWLMNFFLINLFWFLFNFPIVYVVLSMMLVESDYGTYTYTLAIASNEDLYMIILVTLVLLPFIFFPATTAMFSVVRRWIVHKNDSKLIYYYWKGYKENYVRSLLGGLVFVALWVIWILNYSLSAIEIKSGLFYFYLAITIFLIAFTNHFFSDTVHFRLSLFQSLRKSLFITLFQIQYTLGSLAAAGIFIVVAYLIHPIFLCLFFGPVIAYIYFFAYHQIYLRAKGNLQIE